MAARAYDAAKRDRNTEGWIATGGSANAETGPALDIVRRRARDLTRNNPLATSAVRKLAAKIWGTGIVPRPAATEPDESKARLKENWATFVANSDPEGLTTFYGQMNLATRCIVESGESLIRWYDRPASREFPSPVQCEILEPDFLDTLRCEQLSNGNVVIQGIEIDTYGRRAAYWLFDEHPGETPIIRARSYLSKRVPAEQVSHLFDRLRPGQVRGISWFAPVAIAMRDLDDYEFAERLRKKIAACLSVFITRSDDADPVEIGEGKDEERGGQKTGRRLEKIRPGTINYLRQGEEATFVNPPSAEGYAEYMIMQMHAIAAGLGPAYHMLTGDLRQVNYSSMRGGELDFRSLLDGWQQFMAIPQGCAPAWRRIHLAARRLGKGPDEWRPAIWQVPARPWVDPATESEAEDLEFENGTKSWVAAQHERGRDPDEVLTELKEWAPRLAELGIDLFGVKTREAKTRDKKETADAQQQS